MYKRGGIFLDRDGLLNELVHYADTQEWESPRTPEALRLVDGVLEALVAIQAKGWPLFLISNQPNFAKGKTSMEALLAVHHRLEELLVAGGVFLGGAFYCFHHPEAKLDAYRVDCICRKPKPGLLEMAAEKHGLDLGQSWMIGDQATDIECGLRAGCQTVLIPHPGSENKREGSHPHYTIHHLLDFTAYPLERTCL